MRRLVVGTSLLAALAGCDVVLQLEREVVPCADDTFSAPELDALRWRVLEPSNRDVRLELQNGTVALTLPAQVVGRNGLETREALDLSGAAVSIEVLSVPRDPSSELGFYVLAEGVDSYYLLNFYDPHLLVRVRSLGQNDDHVVDYDPVMDRFWRLAHHSETSTMRYETSADGIEWVVRSEEPAIVPLTAATVMVLSDSFTGGPTQDQLSIFDNIAMTGGLCGP